LNRNFSWRLDLISDDLVCVELPADLDGRIFSTFFLFSRLISEEKMGNTEEKKYLTDNLIKIGDE
jgi:hypothetical protein